MNSLNVMVGVTDTSAGVRISETMLMVTEGGSDDYTVVLQKAPTDIVTVSIMSSNEDVTVSPSSLTFNSGNFSVARTVTVSAAIDEATDDEMATITHMVVSNDAVYDRTMVDSVAVAVTDVTQALVLSEISSVAEGGTGSFTVVLSEAPSGDDTVVTVTSGSTADLTVDTDAEMGGNQGELTFTADDFEMPQTVMVMAPDNNADADPNKTVTVTLSPSGGGYSNTHNATVMIKVLDDDITGVAISQMSPVMEGGSGEISVVLGTMPEYPVTVTISSDDTAVLTVTGADPDTGRTDPDVRGGRPGGGPSSLERCSDRHGGGRRGRRLG